MSTGPAPADLELAREFARRLAALLGGHDFTVTLFGSRARGDADPESDLDLFVALGHDDPVGTIEDTATAVASDMTLRYKIPVCAIVADRSYREQHKGYAFLAAVEREGIDV